MNIRAVILCCHLALAVPLLARESTDVIVMKNGDRFTCQIKALNSGVLYVSLPYVIETLSVDWSKVARLESKQLFLVKTESGTVYRGVLNSTESSPDRPIKIEVAETPENKVTIESNRIVDISATSEKFFQRFTGGVDLGFIYSKGNQSSQYSLSGLVGYPRERWAVQAGIVSNLSNSNGVPTSTRNQLSFSGLRLLRKNNYFFGGFDGFLQSTEQGIAGQNALGGGVGRYFKNTNRTVFSVLAGGAWQHTEYHPTIVPIANQQVATAVINAHLNLFRFDKTDLNVNAFVSPALSDLGRVYFSTNATYYIKLPANLSWNVSFYGSWDTQPPGTLSGSDYGTTTGISWTFGTSLRTKPNTIQ
ncbi:DUF481 domain-containing protein [Edaphobacter bradus]|uniref:DUF481 domain-containing protein n=1 Tax=Edaphobacter bradus TaxID=2259016 RepID=UPI0021DF7818|nr:DUF481 domain-containing protein [Edaphobacter bradus]